MFYRRSCMSVIRDGLSLPYFLRISQTIVQPLVPCRGLDGQVKKSPEILSSRGLFILGSRLRILTGQAVKTLNYLERQCQFVDEQEVIVKFVI
jgi:hypothetical protein